MKQRIKGRRQKFLTCLKFSQWNYWEHEEVIGYKKRVPTWKPDKILEN